MPLPAETVSDDVVEDGSNSEPQGQETPAFDEKALEVKVAAKLAALDDDSDEDDADDGDPEVTPPKPAKAAEEGADKEGEDDEADGDEDDEPSEEEAAAAEKAKAEKPDAKPAASTLPKGFPSAYVRSLKASDWTDEEIAEAAVNPKFIQTAAKIHESRNKELVEWTKIGRAKQEEAAKQGAADPNTGLAIVAPIDPKPLKEHYGNDPLIDSILGPVNKAIEQMNKMVPVIQQTQSAAEQSKLEHLGRQVEGFFGHADNAEYREAFGTMEKGAKLSPEQIKTRNDILEMAGALITGAEFQGRSLSMDQALGAARDSLMVGVKEKAIREKIGASLKAREKSMSLKPGGTKPAPSTKPGDMSSVEKRAKARLDKLFG